MWLGVCAAFAAASSGCALKAKPDTPVPAAATESSVSNSSNTDTARLVASADTAQMGAGVASSRAAAAAPLAMPVVANGRAARVLPEVSDDEIVARRLKEAAQAETDPELRARLWREYAIYTGGGTER